MKVVWFELETRAVGQNETNELGSSLGWPKLGIKHEKQLYTDLSRINIQVSTSFNLTHKQWTHCGKMCAERTDKNIPNFS